jgi:hypothetical protein
VTLIAPLSGLLFCGIILTRSETMTEKQEIRVKSMELAIGLLRVLTIPKNSSLDVEDAKRYVDGVAELADSFEALIMKDALG